MSDPNEIMELKLQFEQAFYLEKQRRFYLVNLSSVQLIFKFNKYFVRIV